MVNCIYQETLYFVIYGLCNIIHKISLLQKESFLLLMKEKGWRSSEIDELVSVSVPAYSVDHHILQSSQNLLEYRHIQMHSEVLLHTMQNTRKAILSANKRTNEIYENWIKIQNCVNELQSEYFEIRVLSRQLAESRPCEIILDSLTPSLMKLSIHLSMKIPSHKKTNSISISGDIGKNEETVQKGENERRYRSRNEQAFMNDHHILKHEKSSDTLKQIQQYSQNEKLYYLYSMNV